MRMLALLMVASGAGVLLAGCTARVDPPSEPSVPPPEPRTMPGVVKGRVKTRWLAPCVSVTTRSLGGKGTTTVQWFTPEGKLDRELAGPNVDAHSGYVYEYGKRAGTIYAVNGGWKIALPKKPGPAGYLTATEDSRTFLHEFHPREGEVAADVYRDGKLAATIGPFVQYQGQDVQIGADGSLALLVWKNDPNTARVPGALPPVAVVKDHLLLGGLEYVKWGERREPVRSIHALDPKTGKVTARWLPEPLYQPSSDGGRFLLLGKVLFLVTDDEFAEVSVDDIAGRRNGWR